MYAINLKKMLLVFCFSFFISPLLQANTIINVERPRLSARMGQYDSSNHLITNDTQFQLVLNRRDEIASHATSFDFCVKAPQDDVSKCRRFWVNTTRESDRCGNQIYKAYSAPTPEGDSAPVAEQWLILIDHKQVRCGQSEGDREDVLSERIPRWELQLAEGGQQTRFFGEPQIVYTVFN